MVIQMPLEIRTLRIVVASPLDVQEERSAVDLIANELNTGIGTELGVIFTVSKWETRAYPGFHSHGPQGLIDEILAIPECDIFVGIFWKRFGTPVYDSASGTLHEFNLAYESWKESQKPAIMFYFNEEPYTPKSTEELAQCAQVLELRRASPRRGFGGRTTAPCHSHNCSGSILRSSCLGWHVCSRRVHPVLPMWLFPACLPAEDFAVEATNCNTSRATLRMRTLQSSSSRV